MLLQRLLLAAAFIVVVFILLLCLFQSKLIFVPYIDGTSRSSDDNPRGWRNPGEKGMDYENITLDTEPGVKVHMWLMKQPDYSHCRTIIFFHGNAGNLGHRLPNYEQMYKKLGVNVLAVSYRGFGLSTGTPSEAGIYKDIDVLAEYLRSRSDLEQKRMYVMGRSLGGAVALYMAEKHPNVVAGCIVENTFWNIKSMAALVFKPLKLLEPLSLLDYILLHKFESGQIIKRVKQPIMFISGEKDEIVPPLHMKWLFDAAGSSRRREFIVVAQGTHNESWYIHPGPYYQAIAKFLHNCESGAQGVHKGTIGSAKNISDEELVQQDSTCLQKVVGLFTNEYTNKDE